LNSVSGGLPTRRYAWKLEDVGSECGGAGVGLLSSSQINHFQSAASLVNCNL
jgi:hypothetical protein